jgi:hypothetical protein
LKLVASGIAQYRCLFGSFYAFGGYGNPQGSGQGDRRTQNIGSISCFLDRGYERAVDLHTVKPELP